MFLIENKMVTVDYHLGSDLLIYLKPGFYLHTKDYLTKRTYRSNHIVGLSILQSFFVHNSADTQVQLYCPKKDEDLW